MGRALKITYCDLQESDVEALARLHIQVWDETYRSFLAPKVFAEKNYEQRLQVWQEAQRQQDDEQLIKLAKVGNELAGFVAATAKPRDPIGFDSELMAINILNKFHKLGLGKELMRLGFAFCRSRGAKTIYLWVAEKNHNAISFYENLGGRREVHRKSLYEGSDDICYSWSL